MPSAGQPAVLRPHCPQSRADLRPHRPKYSIGNIQGRINGWCYRVHLRHPRCCPGVFEWAVLLAPASEGKALEQHGTRRCRRWYRTIAGTTRHATSVCRCGRLLRAEQRGFEQRTARPKQQAATALVLSPCLVQRDSCNRSRFYHSLVHKFKSCLYRCVFGISILIRSLAPTSHYHQLIFRGHCFSIGARFEFWRLLPTGIYRAYSHKHIIFSFYFISLGYFSSCPRM